MQEREIGKFKAEDGNVQVMHEPQRKPMKEVGRGGRKFKAKLQRQELRLQ